MGKVSLAETSSGNTIDCNQLNSQTQADHGRAVYF